MTIKDLILSEVSSLENVIIETPVKNLSPMSGAEFVPGVTNPAHSVDRPTVLRPARGNALFSPFSGSSAGFKSALAGTKRHDRLQQ
jgi:hypothetical protein